MVLRSIFLTFILISLQGCDVQRSAEEYLSSGMEFFENDQLDLALVEFRNVVAIDPEMAEAYYQQSRVFARKQRWPAAYSLLEKTVALDAQHLDARFDLVKLYVVSENLDNARKHLEATKYSENRSDRARFAALAGAIEMKSDNFAAAHEFVDEALEADPLQKDVVTVAVSLALVEQNYVRAFQLNEDALKLNPSDSTLLVAQMRIAEAAEDDAKLLQSINRLIATDPSEPTYRTMMVKYHQLRGDSDSSLAVLRDAVAENPESTRMRITLASYLVSIDPGLAISEIESFVSNRSAKEGGDAELFLAKLLQKDNQLEKAESVYLDLIDANPGKPIENTARVEIARLSLQGENADKAGTVIAEVLGKDSGNPEALVLRAIMSLSAGNTEAAISDLRLVIRTQPDNDQARNLLARSYLQNSNITLALQAFRAALEVNPLNEYAGLYMAQVLLAEQSFIEADEILQRLWQENPTPQITNMLLQSKQAQEDWGRMSAIATSLDDPDAKGALLTYIKGLTLQSRGQHAESIQLFQSILDSYPQATSPLLAILQSLDAENGNSIEFLQGYVSGNTDNLQAHVFLADRLSAEGKIDEALSVVEKALKLSPKYSQYHEKLGQYYIEIGDPAAAYEAYKRGYEQTDNLAFKLRMAMTSESEQEVLQAITLYREILDKAPSADIAANNLAMIYATGDSEFGDLEAALELASRFKTSQNAFFLDTLGLVESLSGDYSGAINTLRRAYTLDRENAEILFHLVSALYNNRQFSEARQLLASLQQLETYANLSPENLIESRRLKAVLSN